MEGREEQLNDSPSWCNNIEAIQVIDYVVKLLIDSPKTETLPEHIGIVTPYHRQVKSTVK